MIKKILIGLLALILLLLILGGVYYSMNNEKRPRGQEGEKAEALALKMTEAINKSGWDTTRFITWSFRGEHHYVWDKKEKVVEVKWEEAKALIDIDNVSGRVYNKGAVVADLFQSKELINKAHSFFINDAYWLNAPSMIYNPDVKREYVKNDQGEEGLLVTYMSGGVTPGDSYLWKLGSDGKPRSYKMWVKIIPLGGMEFTWDNWKQLSSGAWVAQDHKGGPLNIPITNIKSGQKFSDLGLSENPFKDLNQKKN